MGILLQFLATRALAPILGTIVLLTMGEHPVSLSKPEVLMKGDTLFISTKLNNGFTKELKEIIKSGTTVTLRLQVEADKKCYFTHTVHYDIEKRVYNIDFGEGVVIDDRKISTDNEEKMIGLVSHFSHIFFLKNEISLSQKIKIRAFLDPVRLDFLDNEEFDLMTLWDYISPQQTIEVKR